MPTEWAFARKLKCNRPRSISQTLWHLRNGTGNRRKITAIDRATETSCRRGRVPFARGVPGSPQRARVQCSLVLSSQWLPISRQSVRRQALNFSMTGTIRRFYICNSDPPEKKIHDRRRRSLPACFAWRSGEGRKGIPAGISRHGRAIIRDRHMGNSSVDGISVPRTPARRRSPWSTFQACDPSGQTPGTTARLARFGGACSITGQSPRRASPRRRGVFRCGDRRGRRRSGTRAELIRSGSEWHYAAGRARTEAEPTWHKRTAATTGSRTPR